MSTTLQVILFFGEIFALKVLDNMFDATRIICIQKNRCVLAGLALSASAFINYFVIKIIATSNGVATMATAAIAAGVGCFLAGLFSTKFSHDRTYVNVIMSKNVEDIREVHQFLTEQHIKHTVTDTYDVDLETKTLTITAFPTTKEKNRKLKEFIKNSPKKFGHVVVE